jgi:5-methylcytosine-specific restriction endonuclease McrA
VSGPTDLTRQAVLRRDGGACVACGRVVALDDGDRMRPIDTYSLQHRTARGMGSRSVLNGPTNLLVMCGTGTTQCHGYTEAHPDWARERGYRVDTWDSPDTVPVVVRTAPNTDQVYLLADDTRLLLYPTPGGVL